jgi:2-polyprenyl-3-methyl-5-hydroxy-6-metoxy-1,4-benzoquinol methylase
VITSSVLEYIDHLNSTLRSINNLLANDGLLIASVPNRSSFYRKLENIGFKYFGFPRYLKVLKNVFTLSEFRTLLKAHGFSIIEFQYYSSPIWYSKILSPLGKQRTCNLILVVAGKTGTQAAVDVPLTSLFTK